MLAPVRDRFWADTDRAFYEALRAAGEHLISQDGVPAPRPGDVKGDAAEGGLEVLRRHAIAIFDDVVPIDSAEAQRIGDIVAARRNLILAFRGRVAAGRRLFKALGLPEPKKKPKKASETTS